MVPEESFFANVARPYDGIAHEYAFSVFDVEGDPLQQRGHHPLRDQRDPLRTATILGNVRMEISPEGLLQDYEVKLFFLKILLFVLSAPIIAIVLYYITISAGMIVDRQRNRSCPQVPRGQHGAGDGVYATRAPSSGSGPGGGAHPGDHRGPVYRAHVHLPGLLQPGAAPGAHHRADAAVRRPGGGALHVRHDGARLGRARCTSSSPTSRRWPADAGPVLAALVLDFLLLAVSGYGYYLLMEAEHPHPGRGGDVFSDPLLLLVPALFIFARR